MTCRVSITDLRIMRMRIMGVVYHLCLMGQLDRYHGSICNHAHTVSITVSTTVLPPFAVYT
jgi:hypothetical protein